MKIACAAGDGIGPEIMAATLELFAAAGVTRTAEFVPVEMGAGEFAKGNTRGMSDACVRTVEDCGLLFKGPMETPKGGGGKSINVTARKLWNAYANYRVFKTLPGVETVYSKAGISIDMAIVRENIEDTYGGVEHRLSSDMVQCKRLISAPGSEQVHRFAFETARKLKIGRVHCGHKANIMKMTDGLFLDRFRAVGAGYPEIECADVIVDALCMNLVLRPQQYRMVVLPNLQGDIVSDLVAGLVGGLGFAPSANIGNHISIFEAVHGTAPDIAGKGVANPTSLILSGLMLLRHLCLFKEASVVENALLTTLESGVHTGDFGRKETPPVGTAAFTRAIIENLGNTPTTVPAVPEAAEGDHCFVRPARPTGHQVIRTFTGVTSEVVGCDIYLDSVRAPAELAKDLGAVCEGTPLKLTLISNRGTQVWPTGSVFTECVDYYRVRFESRAGALTQAACVALLDRVAERFTVCSYELLRTFDGVKGFSLAQGQ
ncbi:MAG: isocitrate dehydrogenase [Phycisphaeraceae bacterium]|nr:MAG: isocitrate dehydrogenase [Phycisphaeraceae bacterium]